MSARIATNDARPFQSCTIVDTYRSQLMQKHDIGSFAGLVAFATECGLTPA